jgi:energy-coupling factor transporter transmembrane protein EcfT
VRLHCCRNSEVELLVAFLAVRIAQLRVAAGLPDEKLNDFNISKVARRKQRGSLLSVGVKWVGIGFELFHQHHYRGQRIVSRRVKEKRGVCEIRRSGIDASVNVDTIFAQKVVHVVGCQCLSCGKPLNEARCLVNKVCEDAEGVGVVEETHRGDSVAVDDRLQARAARTAVIPAASWASSTTATATATTVTTTTTTTAAVTNGSVGVCMPLGRWAPSIVRNARVTHRCPTTVLLLRWVLL